MQSDLRLDLDMGIWKLEKGGFRQQKEKAFLVSDIWRENRRRVDRTNLSFSIERAQGQLLSSWSESGAHQTNNPRSCVRAHPHGVRCEKAC
jgi:hypothetical protein